MGDAPFRSFRHAGRKAKNDNLTTLLGSPARAEVLRLFLVDPSRAYYQRQIEAVTGLPIRAVQRELDRFVAIGLLYRRSEGNRAYYSVDQRHAFYEELRNLVVKSAGPVERLRAMLATQPAIRLAFLKDDGSRVLVVLNGMGKPSLPDWLSACVDAVSSDEFLEALRSSSEPVAGYLRQGDDLLGHRDDVIWKHIESAGFIVKRAQGVA
jgi:DNA-binding transcriptional ArsR family regulator